MGAIEMENSMPRAGSQPTSLAFWASVLTITSPRHPDVSTACKPTCLCSFLPERSVQTTTLGLGVVITTTVSITIVGGFSTDEKHLLNKRTSI